MSANTFGNIFRLTTFGESHGPAIGGVIDGCPAGFELDMEGIQQALDKRKPGQSTLVSQRKESDKVELLSGIFEGKTTGTPIGFVIHNEDQKSKDYSHIEDTFRPSHADYTYQEKYGHRDYRGGGRSSARETACRVVAGAIASQFLNSLGVFLHVYVSAVGEIQLTKHYNHLDFSSIEDTPVRCPDAATAKEMVDRIKEVKKQGDTIGGVVSVVVKGVPVGWGSPIFDKLHACLGKAMLSINAAKGFQFGSGFDGARMLGSEHNDAFTKLDGQITTASNFSGGIQGGISNGSDVYFDVAFKPVATLMQKQQTINMQGEEVMMQGKGRHDPCVLPRAVPIVEAMTALVLLDACLEQRTTQW